MELNPFLLSYRRPTFDSWNLVEQPRLNLTVNLSVPNVIYAQCHLWASGSIAVGLFRLLKHCYVASKCTTSKPNRGQLSMRKMREFSGMKTLFLKPMQAKQSFRLPFMFLITQKALPFTFCFLARRSSVEIKVHFSVFPTSFWRKNISSYYELHKHPFLEIHQFWTLLCGKRQKTD